MAADEKDIPAPVASTVMLARPKAAAKAESYSVSVRNISVQDLLFALSRDAKLNIDVHPGINGVVTLNAIDQTLQQILTRIAKQVDMRWELDGPNLIVMTDSPFLRTYKVDYVNMSRDVSSAVSINTQIASTSSTAAGGTAGSGGNNSTTTVTSKAQNHFWAAVEQNIKDILHETDKILPEGSSETVTERNDQQSTTGTGVQSATSRNNNAATSLAGSPNPANLQQQGTTVVKRTTFREAASVIANPEAGVIVVRATSRQHEKVQEYIDLVTLNAGRQVIIEATIAEVTLNDNYKQGINWQSLRSLRTGGKTAGFSMAQSPTGLDATGAVPDPLAATGTSFLLNYVAPGLGISSTLSLLETFGNVKVLSSPKISVLNNQTAMLKVVDNVVYFEVKSDSTTNQVGTNKSVTTTAKSISVGLVMNVTPQISETNLITLNVRPTISRVTGFKTDPNPDIPAAIPNKVPEIQTREMESVLRLADGEIAVMGGLMEDKINYKTDAVPGLASLPGIGNFFRNRDDTNTKTELVIFLKPTIIRDPSLNGDYRSFRSQLPNRKFFANNPGPEQKQISTQEAHTP
ncbi:MAG: pilus (MSHA type) biogenesis protein MshL [Rugosibacter sp.]|nr:pilus (MSHA type) biogenesis protein MshL [Rugosibacter sp.]